MTELEKTVEALCRCVPKGALDKALAEIEATMPVAKPVLNDPEGLIREIILEIGIPDRLTGHRFVVAALQYAVENDDAVHSITSKLYPTVAEKFGSTSSRAERVIRHAIKVAWDRGNLDVLAKYFGNTVSWSKGKPTNGEFIARVAAIVRQRMKNAT